MNEHYHLTLDICIIPSLIFINKFYKNDNNRFQRFSSSLLIYIMKYKIRVSVSPFFNSTDVTAKLNINFNSMNLINT